MTNEQKYKTPEERVRAFRKYCMDKVECKNYWLDVKKGQVLCIERCVLDWLALEAEEKLLPCPFCGGKSELMDMGDQEYWYVICLDCHMRSHFYAAREFAIAAWNRRAK